MRRPTAPEAPGGGRPAVEPPPATFAERQVSRWREGHVEQVADRIAEEVPLALVYNGRSHAVMLASPADLGDFALGFGLSEGIIRTADELLTLDVLPQDNGIELRMTIPPERAAPLLEASRALTGRTGCGLCGARSLAQAVRRPEPVGRGVTTTADALHRALAAIRDGQRINRLTGAVHAAAWTSPEGDVLAVREDVGRHNALDKLIGALAREGTDFSAGVLLVTSRASYEMVQKATTVGITLMAAISAPTALAVRLADAAGLTLVGFARRDSHVVYTHPWRLDAHGDSTHNGTSA